MNWKQTFNPKKIWKWEVEVEYYKFMFFIIFTLFTLSDSYKSKNIF